MMKALVEPAESAIPILPVTKSDLVVWLESQSTSVRAWVQGTGFEAKPETICPLPDNDGGVGQILFGVPAILDPWCFSSLRLSLPQGTYRLIEERFSAFHLTQAAIAWMVASHRFDRYKSDKKAEGTSAPRLAWPDKADRAQAESIARAIVLVRDLINMPACDLGPEELTRAVRNAVDPFHVSITEIVGADLMTQNYPMVFAVGQAASRLPRLIDVRWGDEGAPKVTLVGKGVCFDSGGLDIKAAGNMKIMKKDMGGAAHALSLAVMIMEAKLPVRLRLLIPAVENAVSGNAFRPMDILNSRKGVTVEVGNTDAEGRLILADALWEGASEQPSLLIDCATLTGAARVALGTELPALFCNDDALAADLMRHGMNQGDPVWQLPLWKGYRSMLDSKVADLNSAPEGPYGGAITAALFLQEFIGACPSWIHLDMLAWNNTARPGRPEGGEAVALRALFALLEERFQR